MIFPRWFNHSTFTLNQECLKNNFKMVKTIFIKSFFNSDDGYTRYLFYNTRMAIYTTYMHSVRCDVYTSP